MLTNLQGRGNDNNKFRKGSYPQQNKEGLLEGVVSPGETGVWVSCARSQEAKAAREVVAMFDEVCSFADLR
jgi:tRNA acetyltransferase TAN1